MSYWWVGKFSRISREGIRAFQEPWRVGTLVQTVNRLIEIGG